MAEEVLSERELNRALLARQHLLRRADRGPREEVEHLVGLQAQDPLPPYLGLAARLEGFDPFELGGLIEAGELVRMKSLRGTVHMTTVDDALFLRPLTQVVNERSHRGAFGKRIGTATPELIEAAVRELLAAEPLTAREAARRLIARGIGDDLDAIAAAVPAYVPLVQLPPRGVWGKRGQARYATLEDYTGREPEAEPSRERLVLRYLAAFGPASVADAQNWSGLTRLKDAFEALRPRLVSFRNEDGRELFDLPDAPRPGADADAPVRILGEFDNVLLGHADRRRIIPADFPWGDLLEGLLGRRGGRRAAAGRRRRTVSHVLVDGFLRAVWWLDSDAGEATLSIRPHRELSADERDAVAAEAERTLELLAADADRRRVAFEDPIE